MSAENKSGINKSIAAVELAAMADPEKDRPALRSTVSGVEDTGRRLDQLFPALRMPQ
jgi:hypothetical protein